MKNDISIHSLGLKNLYNLNEVYNNNEDALYHVISFLNLEVKIDLSG